MGRHNKTLDSLLGEIVEIEITAKDGRKILIGKLNRYDRPCEPEKCQYCLETFSAKDMVSCGPTYKFGKSRVVKEKGALKIDLVLLSIKDYMDLYLKAFENEFSERARKAHMRGEDLRDLEVVNRISAEINAFFMSENFRNRDDFMYRQGDVRNIILGKFLHESGMGNLKETVEKLSKEKGEFFEKLLDMTYRIADERHYHGFYKKKDHLKIAVYVTTLDRPGYVSTKRTVYIYRHYCASKPFKDDDVRAFEKERDAKAYLKEKVEKHFDAPWDEVYDKAGFDLRDDTFEPDCVVFKAKSKNSMRWIISEQKIY